MTNLDAEANAEATKGKTTYFHGKSEAPYSLLVLATELCVSLRHHSESEDDLRELMRDTVIIAVIYIGRAMERARPENLLNRFTKHRLLLTAFLLVMKFHFDIPMSNKCYAARIPGLSLAEVNRMESDFLYRIDFRLKIEPEELQNANSKINE